MRIRYEVALGLLSLLLAVAILRRLATGFLSGKGTAICPQCGSCYISPSQTPAFRDYPFSLFGWLAYRCQVCSYRFYRPRFSAS